MAKYCDYRDSFKFTNVHNHIYPNLVCDMNQTDSFVNQVY
jgi:hypothetical protein